MLAAFPTFRRGARFVVPTSRSIVYFIMSSDSPHPARASHDAVVYFDGVCGLCNHSINWLLAHDPERKLRFAPLQGSSAEANVPASIRQSLNTLVFTQAGQVHVRTAAVSRILMTLGGRWKLAGILLWIIPFPLRDLGYRMVSSLRYRLFGKHDACRLPSPEERAVFLD
jgi:predicted DCC family thiol-disulfide oxidoreductase YuxK